MIIKTKNHAKDVVHHFEDFFKFDTPGQKHYVYFDEKGTDNTLTIMKYTDGALTLNRRGADWAEDGETQISEEECQLLLWKNRKKINEIIAKRMEKRRG